MKSCASSRWMQEAYAFVNGQIHCWPLPAPDVEVVDGVQWGSPAELLSPAYWAVLAKVASSAGLGFVCKDGDLASELGFCLLGGFGIAAEVASVAHGRLSDAGVFTNDWRPDHEHVRDLLLQPLRVKSRLVRYRFPH